MTLARAVKLAKTSLPPEVTAGISLSANENFDAEQSLAVGANIPPRRSRRTTRTIRTSPNTWRKYAKDLVETGQEALEELARKRKR